MEHHQSWLGGNIYRFDDAKNMYCPKCCKNIPDERLEEIDKQLQEQFNKDSLAKGLCPVCGTKLIALKKKAPQ
jgi:hypothetical protein